MLAGRGNHTAPWWRDGGRNSIGRAQTNPGLGLRRTGHVAAHAAAAGIALTVAGVFALSACSSSDADDTEAMEPTPVMTEEAPMEEAPMEDDAMEMDAYANLVGTECAVYDETVPEGAGSVQGMSQDPVAVAASNNPLLTTLTAAVSGELNPDVNLVDTVLMPPME